jgi:GTPase SAR1 family protein
MGKYLKKVKWDKEDFEHARKFINQISILSKENFLGYDTKGFKELEYIMSNNEKILVPAFGQYSSGKSTLLNVLIGEDYLPTSEGVCTNKGVIIEYTSNVDISELYEAKIKFETEFSKFFVIEKKKLISNDRTKIKSEIDKINRQHKSIQFEDSFLLLRVYIEFFELFEKEEREKILLIDFPGLGVLQKNNFFNSEVLGPLINQSDSFLFFNNEVINSDENQKIIINIVEKIRNRKISFSYNNCLFIMNKWDKHRKDNSTYTLDEAKKELEQIFSNNQLSDIFSDIDIINCSANDYKAFLSKKKNIIDFEKYFDTLKSDFEDFYKEEEDEEDEE